MISYPEITFAAISYGHVYLLRRMLKSFADNCLDLDLVSDFICVSDRAKMNEFGKVIDEFPNLKIYPSPRPGYGAMVDHLFSLIKTEWVLICNENYLFIRRDNFIRKAVDIAQADRRIRNVGLEFHDCPYVKKNGIEFRLFVYRSDPIEPEKYSSYVISPALHHLPTIKLFGFYGLDRAEKYRDRGFRWACLPENYVILIKNEFNELISTFGRIDIIIPSLKTHEELRPMMAEVDRTAELPHRIIATGIRASAAVNRNFGLKCADSKIIIQLDDDISGFYPGWDRDLIQPFLHDPTLAMVSARLMTPDGKAGANCAKNFDLNGDYIQVRPQEDAVIPSSAIAFRNLGIMFDDRYKGSGFEDTAFCYEYYFRDKNYKFLISNLCRLIHANEAKNQGGANWEFNRGIFREWKKSKQKK